MVDTNLTDLTEITSPLSTDIAYVVSDPTVTKLPRKSLLSNILKIYDAITATLSNKTLTAPKFADLGFIADANGAELVTLDTVASAVNEIKIANAATATNPSIIPSASAGSDTNTGILLAGKGTGLIQVGDGADNTKIIQFDSVGATTAKKLTIASSHTLDRTITIPNATDTLVGKATTDTLTNKTIDADGTGNSITNIENADIKAAAAIDATKIADGTVTSTEFQYINTLSSNAQTQLNAKQASITSITRTNYVPCVIEVPQDTVAYPDVLSLTTGADKITGFWLPNSATSEINFKCICPTGLAGTPAAKLIVHMLPRTTVANSTVNLTISRLYSSATENLDAAHTAEAATDVNLDTSTLNYLSVWTFSLTANPTATELFTGRLKRIPSATNDDFTEDLFIMGITMAIDIAETIT